MARVKKKALPALGLDPFADMDGAVQRPPDAGGNGARKRDKSVQPTADALENPASSSYADSQSTATESAPPVVSAFPGTGAMALPSSESNTTAASAENTEMEPELSADAEETGFEFPWSTAKTASTPPVADTVPDVTGELSQPGAPLESAATLGSEQSDEVGWPFQTQGPAQITAAAPGHVPDPLAQAPEPPALAAPVQEGELDHLLDDLISNVDKEMDQALGPGAMDEMVPPAAAAGTRATGDEQHILFSLAGTFYSTLLSNVIEIGRPVTITPVPNLSDWVFGVANLRGDIVSMVDLRRFLGMAPTTIGPNNQMLVARAAEEDVTAGVIVDRVNGVRFVPTDQIKPPTAPIADRVAPYLRGIYEQDDRIIIVLDFNKLLLSPEMRQFEPV